jgi:hypothetical protein
MGIGIESLRVFDLRQTWRNPRPKSLRSEEMIVLGGFSKSKILGWEELNLQQRGLKCRTMELDIVEQTASFPPRQNPRLLFSDVRQQKPPELFSRAARLHLSYLLFVDPCALAPSLCEGKYSE